MATVQDKPADRKIATPTQRIVKIRRDYNNWVANETIEDYALRYTPKSFRKWSIFQVTNTALGSTSFLVLEAIGGTLVVNYGFINAFWAILAVAAIVIITGLPISFYAAKHGVDMDLLTRGAGFGYIGSTISSFIYASFTFILFALEAAIMAYALELSLGLPLYLGYLVSALIVIPLVTHGITWISRIQMITQPIWLGLMCLPFWYIWQKEPSVFNEVTHFAGANGQAQDFNWLMFGAATAIGVALIPQIGEQVDFLRFMPDKTAKNQWRWNLGVFLAGPGWSLIGVLKMLAGTVLAYLVIAYGWGAENAVNPTHMYSLGFNYVFNSQEWALLVTAVFVVVSQIKINMTNAYAGSLAWSNFFARLTHRHPGRVVWMLFNAIIAIILMELNVFKALEQVLGLYANIAIAWIAAVVADLMINKPLGLSPQGIEFRRAYLYDINPVGVGAMLIASLVSVAAFFGAFGEDARAFSAFIALGLAFVLSPCIAWLTKGKFYLARPIYQVSIRSTLKKCVVCERKYEVADMATCPAYGGSICSLCCSLDARCHDVCKPHGKLSEQWMHLSHLILPKKYWPYLKGGVASYLLFMVISLSIFGAFFGLMYFYDITTLSPSHHVALAYLKSSYLKSFMALAFASAMVAWWFVLTSESRRVAQDESNRQTGLLLQEIESHKKTDAALQHARQVAEEANQAKSRYITGISHELRTPLNSILGYAQLLSHDESIPEHRRQAIRTISRGGEHLLSLIESTLDIARIESGKMTFDLKPLNFKEFIEQVVSMFEIQAVNKGLQFHYEPVGRLPDYVRADQKRLTQILVNVLGNAVKFTSQGSVTFRVRYAREIAHIDIIDTGHGISAKEREHIFIPFERGQAADKVNIGGTGLGLTISRLLTQLMGGEIDFKSEEGKGTHFEIRLFLSQIRETAHLQQRARQQPVGYLGNPKVILVVDNEAIDRALIKYALEPLGFIVEEAANGKACVESYQACKADLILMDLAMPVMDGWEAAYIIKQTQQATLPIAIVSANAYDKNLDNQAKIPSEDFFVKPIDMDLLLDWIANKLGLTWVYNEKNEHVHESKSLSRSLPKLASNRVEHSKPALPQVILDEFLQMAELGFVKGIKNRLTLLSETHPQHTWFIATVKEALLNFNVDAVKRIIQEYPAC